ncbi:MAG: ATP-binding protein [Myxococcaceae bacterium]
MKSEPNISTLPATPEGAFEAFFDLVDAPAALCDLSLRIVKANAPFEVLCGAKDLAGHDLGDYVEPGALTIPGEGRSDEIDVTCKTGQLVSLTITRRGRNVAVIARRLSPMLDSLAAAGRALLEQARVETALLEIGRNVAGATSEEELVATVARGVKGLFPGRAFCVRIVDPRTCHLTSLYAEGRMRDGQRDVFHLRRSMVEKTHLETRGLPADRVSITTGELPLLFQGSVRGIAAPLVASGQLFGAVNIEYPAGLTADVLTDERILIQLANQVAVAVRNAKLIDELTFMRKYLEELLENANALILVVNREGRVVVFNHALVQLTGRAKADVLGTDITHLMPEGERLKLLRVFGAALRGQPVSGVESALVGKNQREIRIAFNTSAVMSQSGEVEGVMAIGQDLTKMRELERQVIQAEKLASLGQLAASVVHEINNPMTAVSTYADALWQRARTAPNADPADVDKYKRIVDNSERVLRFTRDLVSYARPAQEKPELVQLNTVLEKAISFCDHVLHKHGVKLEKQFQPVPDFMAVRQNLVQVFVNLITNACHATPSGGKVTVTTTVDGDQAKVSVADTGSGISPETQARIFEPFFTTKPDGKGTGLGLSIVQGIMESHGGSISVKSEVGKGTEFTLTLPMVKPV